MSYLHSASSVGRFVPKEQHVFWGERVSELLQIIAINHGFDLMRLGASEAYRLKGFLDTLEQSDYSELTDWNNRVFACTRLTCRVELEKYMLEGMPKS
jgi:hypothetical protein